MDEQEIRAAVETAWRIAETADLGENTPPGIYVEANEKQKAESGGAKHVFNGPRWEVFRQLLVKMIPHSFKGTFMEEHGSEPWRESLS